jgi:hypothetical protein
VRGKVGRALGNYVYDKYTPHRQDKTPCEVHVFPLAVERQLKKWPEAKEREARWYSVAEAASLVGGSGLRNLTLQLQTLEPETSATRTELREHLAKPRRRRKQS